MADDILASLAKAPARRAAVRASSNEAQAQINTLIKLVLLHDRQIQALEDRSSISLKLKDGALKDAVLEARTQWKNLEPPRDKEKAEANVEHPMKCSLRSLVHSVIVTAVRKSIAALPAGTEKDDLTNAINAICALKAVDIDMYCFRLKPRFKDPHKDPERPWTWSLMFGIEADQSIIKHWFTIARSRAACTEIAVKPARSFDGGLSKQLRDILKVANIPLDEDDDEDDGVKKRHRKAGA